MADKNYVPPELQVLIELGKAKKLWAIDAVYKIGGETKVVRKRNMTDAELMKFRESMFRYGFTHPVEAGHWKIVCPIDIVEVDMYRQDAYLPDLPTGSPK
jgi:hypothetical protein